MRELIRSEYLRLCSSKREIFFFNCNPPSSSKLGPLKISVNPYARVKAKHIPEAPFTQK